VSYRIDLDEIPEKKLQEEIFRRSKMRSMGVCDYCERVPDAKPCKFPERHEVGFQAQPAGLDQLANYLIDRPDLYKALLVKLLTPLHKCEGWQGACDFDVVYATPSMTAYEWDGKGEDPNASKLLCPRCSEGYMDQMQSQWDEYHAGLL